MGLSASQARLLFLTARKSDIEFNEMKIANAKISLSRDTEKVSEAYANALNAKKITWAVDGNTTSDSTVDLTYNLLMTPNSTNIAEQYLIADSYGRVVLSDDYANLLGGNNGSSIGISRNEFLNFFGLDGTKYPDKYAGDSGDTTTGTPSTPTPCPITSSDIDALTATWTGLSTTQAVVNSDGRAVTSKSSARTVYQELSRLMSQLSQISSELSTAASTESDPATKAKYLQDSSNINKLSAVLQKINRDYIENQDWTGADKDRLQGVITGVFGTNGDKNWSALQKGWDGSNNIGVTFADIQNGINFKSVMKELQTNYSNSTNPTNPTNPTPPQNYPDQDKADFYTNLYYAIKAKGWVRSSPITDKTFLQNGLQSGNLYLQKLNPDGSWSNISMSDPSSPIRVENDEDAIAKAEAKYQMDSDKLNTKEKKLDLELKNLDTERSALDTEIDSVKTVITKNVERSFKIFSA